MAVAHLVGSTYTRSNANYTRVTDPDNMYDPVSDTSDYATLRGRNRNSSTAYYVFIHGFDFSQIPSNATVTNFAVKVKCYRSSNQRTGTNFYLRLSYAHTSGSVISGTTTSTNIGTDTDGSIITIPTGSLTWSDIVGYGSDFSIEFPLASTSSSYPYIYVYGAEIEVTYSLPTQYSITIQNSSSATVTASDTTPYEGDDVEIFTNTISGLTITDNNTNVTSQFVQAQGGTINATAESYTTELSASNADFYLNSSQTGNHFNYAVGHTAESPGHTSEDSTYVKDNGNNTATGWAIYGFDFSEIPSTATISSVSVKCYGFTESTTHDSTHKANIKLYSGSTQKGSEQYFTSTSNQTITLSNVGTWTASELHDATLHFEVAYYGGGIFGITWTVVYEVEGYVYTIISVAANHTIVVTSGGSQPIIYYKVNGAWVAATAVYKKVNGSWVQQTNLSTVFDNTKNYVKG